MGAVCSITSVQDGLYFARKDALAQSGYYVVKLYRIFNSIKVEADGAAALTEIQQVQPVANAVARKVEPDAYVTKARASCCGCGDISAKTVTEEINKINAEIAERWAMVKEAYVAAIAYLKAYEHIRSTKDTLLVAIGTGQLQTLEGPSLTALLTLPNWTGNKDSIIKLVTERGYGDPLLSDARAQVKTEGLPQSGTLIALTNEMVITFGRAVITNG